MADKALTLALALANKSGGGSGLPPVTEEDNGKTVSVENGEWKVGEVPYAPTKILFSDTAEVIDLEYVEPEPEPGPKSPKKTITLKPSVLSSKRLTKGGR